MTDPDTEDELEARLRSLPAEPGCYLFSDRSGELLYVGKAKNLRSRVRSYFQAGSSDTRAFIPFLRAQVGTFETIVTGSEKEAAILENNLIKERRPRYNVKLRDDKEYLSLRLDLSHEWPRPELVRRPKPDGARYFGPYHSATAARRTLHLVEKHFKLRSCSDRELASRKRPCLEYQIQRCPAPCVYDVDREQYTAQVRAVSLFLAGRHDELTRELETRMREASARLEFELAATYRDQLAAVESVRQAQRVVAVSDRDQDVLGLYREGDLVELSLMVVRAGRVIDVGSFSNRRVEVPDDEVVASFLREHYGDGGGAEGLIPDEVLVPVLPEGIEGVIEWLTERRQAAARARGERAGRVEILSPSRGPRRGLVELAVENARHAFREKRRTEDDIEERLLRVQARLRLPTLPRRIECVDISHLGGIDTVGAVVALENGVPDKKRYRTYHVRGRTPGDDYAAIYEVLSRRFRRGRDAKERAEAAAASGAARSDAEGGAKRAGTAEPVWDLPDLFVVDGGRGQLAVALAAAHDLGLHDLCIVGLAKERESPLGERFVDRVYLPGQKNPIPLRPNTPELFLLARARDEAHRFSNRGRKVVGKRRSFASELDAIPGIGPKTRTALLRRFGSLDAIDAASDDELLATPNVTRRHVTALRAARPKLAEAPPAARAPAEKPEAPEDRCSVQSAEPGMGSAELVGEWADADVPPSARDGAEIEPANAEVAREDAQTEDAHVEHEGEEPEGAQGERGKAEAGPDGAQDERAGSEAPTPGGVGESTPESGEGELPRGGPPRAPVE
ncbi:MAG TPA: excinuclease ABC subunit UvrC [Polyangiaceae bacterium]|nr:excinuclease ABC subunit UvrC [Polyangiaceae bacterium]